ncbi:hypothetical protein ATCC90586_002126 [Pythium insidiosum]|nr:hypothetical protein ATCC90586_002126 [Pythium insidiosum]
MATAREVTVLAKHVYAPEDSQQLTLAESLSVRALKELLQRGCRTTRCRRSSAGSSRKICDDQQTLQAVLAGHTQERSTAASDDERCEQAPFVFHLMVTSSHLAAAMDRDGFIRAEAFAAWCMEETRFDELDGFLRRSFGDVNVQIMERQNDFCRFKLRGSNDQLKLSKVFALVEDIKTRMHIREYILQWFLFLVQALLDTGLSG